VFLFVCVASWVLVHFFGYALEEEELLATEASDTVSALPGVENNAANHVELANSQHSQISTSTSGPSSNHNNDNFNTQSSETFYFFPFAARARSSVHFSGFFLALKELLGSVV